MMFLGTRMHFGKQASCTLFQNTLGPSPSRLRLHHSRSSCPLCRGFCTRHWDCTSSSPTVLVMHLQFCSPAQMIPPAMSRDDSIGHGPDDLASHGPFLPRGVPWWPFANRLQGGPGSRWRPQPDDIVHLAIVLLDTISSKKCTTRIG
jgi:hypothetical protein